MTGVGFSDSRDRVVMGLDCVMILQLEIAGQSLRFFACERAFIVSQLMFFRFRQFLREKNDRVILIVYIRSLQFTPCIHDFGVIVGVFS